GRVSVAVLEREFRLFSHTSTRSARQIQPSYGPPPIGMLTEATLDVLTDPTWGFPTGLLTPRPLYLLSLTESTNPRTFEDTHGITPVNVATIEAAFPALRRGLTRTAAVDAAAVEADVDTLLAHYTRAAEDAGVRILTGSGFEEVDRVGNRWVVRAGDLVVEAGTVVNAAGAWADGVAEAFGAAPRGLSPMRRTVAVAAPRERDRVDPGWPMLADADDSFYLRPQGRHVLASVLEDEPSIAEDARPYRTVVRSILDRVNDVTDLDLRNPVQAWTGLRTVSPDGLPVVGRDGRVEGFYWLAGQGGYGIQTSAGLAEAVAAELLDREIELPEFHRERARLAMVQLRPDRSSLPAWC
ncbi:MAG: NAD(P)/FAD-dependent oxidoreductase, partial [Janthinobacterium lividum]